MWRLVVDATICLGEAIVRRVRAIAVGAGVGVTARLRTVAANKRGEPRAGGPAAEALPGSSTVMYNKAVGQEWPLGRMFAS